MCVHVIQFSPGRNKGATEVAQEAQWRQCGGFGYDQDEAERRVSGGSASFYVMTVYFNCSVLLASKIVVICVV